MFISYGTDSPKTKIAILLNLSQGGSQICQVKHLFVKPKRVRNSKVNWIWKRIHGILHGGLASVKVNPELSQNKRHGQWNEQIIKKKKYKNCFIKFCFKLVGPEFDQFKHPLLLEDSTPKRRPTNTKEFKLYKWNTFTN